jgi:hypothetical protein
MISSQGSTVTTPTGIIVLQTIGQQSSTGNSNENYIVMQGFQQSLWNRYISSNSIEGISTKTYPNPFIEIIKFQFSKPISEPIRITVYEASGRLIFEKMKTAEDTVLSVDLSHLSRSIYLVHLYTSIFSYYTQIIKQ